VRRGEWRKPAERALGRRYGIEIVSPGSAEEAALLVRERMALDQRPAVVIAAGGDGTVRLVAQELSGTGVPLGVLPLGTGNDFAHANGTIKANSVKSLPAPATDPTKKPGDATKKPPTI
jgi:diacylglycerol kinase (ATP)